MPPVHEGGGDPHPEEEQARLSPAHSLACTGSQLTSVQVILWSDLPAGLGFPSRMRRWWGWLLALGCKGKARQALQWWRTSSHCPNTVLFVIGKSVTSGLCLGRGRVEWILITPLTPPRELQEHHLSLTNGDTEARGLVLSKTIRLLLGVL